MTIAAISVFDITITLSPCHVARDTCRDSHAAQGRPGKCLLYDLCRKVIYLLGNTL